MTLHAPATRESMGISDDLWSALNPESRRIIEAACLSKGAWPSAKAARENAARLSERNADAHGARESRPAQAYPCPFVLSDGHHFHVGRVPDLATMEATARTIRDLHGTRPPTWVDGIRPETVESRP